MNFLPYLIANKLYLKKNKNCIIILISILSKIGISISVFALIMSFSALNGFEVLLNKTILSNFPHGIIQLTDKSSLKWIDIVKKLKSSPGIIYSEPYIVNDALLLINNKFKPIEIKSFNNSKNIKKELFFHEKSISIKDKENKYNIILSSYLANTFSIKIGDYIDLIILDQTNNIFHSKVQKFSLIVKNIFKSDGFLDSNIAYMPFKFFENVMNTNNFDKIELHMSDPFNADKIIINAAKKINTPLFLYTWINSYKYIYNDIKKIKATIYFILVLLVSISCFSIASISFMNVSKKTREIAILRSMGANNFLIQLIFLYYGLRYIIVGIFWGLFLSIGIILNFKKILFFLENNFKDNIIFNNIYYNNFFLLKLNLSDVIIIFISTIIIGIVTNFYPAYYASKINPSKILKEY